MHPNRRRSSKIRGFFWNPPPGPAFAFREIIPYPEAMEIRSVVTSEAPTPAGHYSQAIVHNGLVYVAGQLPIDPATGERKTGPIEEQAEQVLRNLRAILQAAGSDLDRVLKMTVYISDIGLWGKVNEVYARMLGEHRPARAVVPVNELHHGFKIEIEAIAALKDR
jgi:2-iminobutanoate/2-iminopropanoate deaminase